MQFPSKDNRVASHFRIQFRVIIYGLASQHLFSNEPTLDLRLRHSCHLAYICHATVGNVMIARDTSLFSSLARDGEDDWVILSPLLPFQANDYLA